MNSDHGGQLPLILYVTSFRHQHQVPLPQEERGGEQARGVDGGQVVAVEEGGALALIPRPNKDVIESMIDCMLDGYQEVLIPVPVYPNPPPVVIERAVPMLAVCWMAIRKSSFQYLCILTLLLWSLKGLFLCWLLSSLKEVSLLIFLTGKLSGSVMNSLHISNFPQTIFRLISIPLRKTLCQKVESSSALTSWNFFPDHDILGVWFSSSSSSVFFKALYSSKFSFLQRCFQKCIQPLSLRWMDLDVW